MHVPIASHKSQFHFDDSGIKILGKPFKNRARAALGFVKSYLDDTTPRQLSARFIDKTFSSQSTPISRYLRLILLLCTNERFSADKKISKQYVYNPKGVTYLVELLDGNTTLPWSQWRLHFDASGHSTRTDSKTIKQATNDFVIESFHPQLESGDFTYTDKSNRLWNPIQNIRKSVKKPLLAQYGYSHQFDVQTCAPTLIHQEAMRLGMTHECTFIENYLANKTEWRNTLAAEFHIAPAKVKMIINAMFCGAKLGSSEYFSIFKLVERNTRLMTKMKNHELLVGLKEDIRQCWNTISPFMDIKFITDKNGKTRKKALDSKTRWDLYFRLERKVLNVAKEYMDENGFKYFLEHDGWACNQYFDPKHFSDYVFQVLGYRLNFDYEQIDCEGNVIVKQENIETFDQHVTSSEHKVKVVNNTIFKFTGRSVRTYTFQKQIYTEPVFDDFLDSYRS